MEYLLKSKLFWPLVVIWFIYGTIVDINTHCSEYAEKYDDGWYLVEIESGDSEVLSNGSVSEEPDTFHYDGPYKKQEVVDYINECYDKSKKYMKSFGTIYRIFPTYEPKFYGDNFYAVPNNNFFYSLIAFGIRIFPVILFFGYLFLLEKGYFKTRNE